MSQYTIINKNDPREDTTPISPRSPSVNNASSPTMSTGGKVATAYGAVVGRRGFQMTTGELRARGNVRTAQQLENFATGATYAGISLTMPKLWIPIAINEASGIIQNIMERQRENRETAVMNNLRIGRTVGSYD